MLVDRVSSFSALICNRGCPDGDSGCQEGARAERSVWCCCSELLGSPSRDTPSQHFCAPGGFGDVNLM